MNNSSLLNPFADEETPASSPCQSAFPTTQLNATWDFVQALFRYDWIIMEAGNVRA